MIFAPVVASIMEPGILDDKWFCLGRIVKLNAVAPTPKVRVFYGNSAVVALVYAILVALAKGSGRRAIGAWFKCTVFKGNVVAVYSNVCVLGGVRRKPAANEGNIGGVITGTANVRTASKVTETIRSITLQVAIVTGG